VAELARAPRSGDRTLRCENGAGQRAHVRDDQRQPGGGELRHAPPHVVQRERALVRVADRQLEQRLGAAAQRRARRQQAPALQRRRPWAAVGQSRAPAAPPAML